MQLQTIKIAHFKNYKSEDISFCQGVNSIVGNNGMGKTNLLDAIYYSCMSKSYFGLSDKAIILHEEQFFRLDAKFITDKEELVVVKYQKGKKKEISLNGKNYEKYADHIGRFPVVMVSPDDISIVLEGSEVRRKFLDNVLCQEDSAYLKNIIQYNRILKQRNAALKKMGEERGIDNALLTSYDLQMIPLGNDIFERRKLFLEEFVPVLKAMYLMISDGQEEMDCIYKSSLLKEDFEKLLIDHREKDFYLQYTSVGIHKDDLVFSYEERPLKKYASQGQRKTFLLAIKLAQFEFLRRRLAKKPILLLDDIFDKLDPKRMNKLIHLLCNENFGQVFISDTHEVRLEKILKEYGLEFKHYKVIEGKLVDGE